MDLTSQIDGKILTFSMLSSSLAANYPPSLHIYLFPQILLYIITIRGKYFSVLSFLSCDVCKYHKDGHHELFSFGRQKHKFTSFCIRCPFWFSHEFTISLTDTIILMVAIMKTISPSGRRSGGQIATWQRKAPLTMGTTKQPNVSQFFSPAFHILPSILFNVFDEN